LTENLEADVFFQSGKDEQQGGRAQPIRSYVDAKHFETEVNPMRGA
jgi:hypothetical protein